MKKRNKRNAAARGVNGGEGIDTNRGVDKSRDGVERDRRFERQPMYEPYPVAQLPAQAIVMPQQGPYQVVGNGMPMGLPVYTAKDQYGRVFSPIMNYGPQPHSAPVPVATPSSIVQLTPIVSPVSFVPYATQNQALYQYDDEPSN